MPNLQSGLQASGIGPTSLYGRCMSTTGIIRPGPFGAISWPGRASPSDQRTETRPFFGVAIVSNGAAGLRPSLLGRFQLLQSSLSV